MLNHEVRVKTNGDFQRVCFSVRPLSDPDAGEGLLLVSFQDLAEAAPGTSPAKPARGKRAGGSADAPAHRGTGARAGLHQENLQANIEEQQASNEELKSTNEEMQSTNEELQSTNEELETSKEELQSINEELVTVNAELQSKIEQLAGMQNDMKNLLDNINIGTVSPRRAPAHPALHARSDARLPPGGWDIGRPLADIKSNSEGEDLLGEARAVLDTLVPREREVRTLDGASTGARPALPHAGERHRGRGADLADISQRVAAEAAVEEGRALAEGIVDTVREPAHRARWRHACRHRQPRVLQNLPRDAGGNRGLPALRPGQPPVGHSRPARPAGACPAEKPQLR
ncbi:MAG: hypothetical protein M5R42_19805 [Rhodocyclaceae bacterium]|nr:hypothetical protein [Rhodocyclaceae bacterium]